MGPSLGRQSKGENVGLFSSKPKVKPEPIPMEQRPIVYIRWPVCKHRADEEECGCHSWDVQVGSTYGIDESAPKDLLPNRRGSTKRTVVNIPAGQDGKDSVSFYSVGGERIGWAMIPPNKRNWAVSDEARMVYQVWLIVTRVDEADFDDEPQYEAALRMGRKGEILQFDEDDPTALAF